MSVPIYLLQKYVAATRLLDTNARANARSNLPATQVAAARSLDTNARANVRSNLPATQVAATRFLDTNARANARSNLPATQVDATRSLNTNARQTARDRDHVDAVLPRSGASGTLAMPNDFPTSVFLNNFEHSVLSAQSLFWARSGNYLFAAWRDFDFSTTPSSQVSDSTTTVPRHLPEDLRAAIQDEVRVTDADLVRCVSAYTARMDPT
jgi:hypothetical protein